MVAAGLEDAAPEIEVEVVPIRTAGDERARGAPRDGPAPGGDKSRFVREIEDALLRAEVDLAVHSAKDVPGELPPGLAIVGVPERADASDALCGVAALAELPEGAVVGTSSLRRRAQLLAERPDLEVRELRGNVDTRLRRLAEGGFDAIVLAAAGLARLGRSPGGPLPPDVMTPAPGQGCLALEARADDERATGLARRLIHRGSLLRLTAERALVAAMDASCRTPVGAHAVLDGGALSVSAFVGMPDGSAWIRDSLTGNAEEPGDVGRAVADRLLAAGADEMLAAAERYAAPSA
jgi:hydroxymethylbilane synthase